MTTTIGSLDLTSANSLYNDATQYFWFESDSTATYGAGVHITLSPSATFMNNPTGQNILMNTDGISIRNGLLPMMILDNDSLDFNVVDTTNNMYTNVASFGTATTIGITDGTQSYLYEDYHSLQMIDKEGHVYFYVSDLRDATGMAEITNTFTGDGSRHSFYCSFSIDSVVEVTIDDEFVSDANYRTYTDRVTFNTPPVNDAVIVIKYKTTDRNVKAYTLGERAVGDIGAMSYAEGVDNTSSGIASHAEGSKTTASGAYSHAEGYETTARYSSAHAEGYQTYASTRSHAEGDNTVAYNGSHAEGCYTMGSGQVSHAEGRYSYATGNYSHSEGGGYTTIGTAGMYTEASGDYSHAEGYGTRANGYASHSEGSGTVATGRFSHSQNAGTIADQDYQTAIGTYNTANNTDNLFVVGNGISGNRSDAFTVNSNGDVNISGYYQANTVMIGSSISIRGEDDVTMSLTTNWKTPSMRVTDYNYGNAFIDANDTSLTDETSGVYCYYDGLVQVQGTIRFVNEFTANDNLYVRIENATQGTTMNGITRFRTPMTAPNETSISPTQVMRVSAGDVIKVGARNATGSRGIVANNTSYLNMTYIAPILPIPT